MPSVPTLVDTGPLVALLNKSQPTHQLCKETFAELSTPLLTCWPVLTEAAYLLRKFPVQVRSLVAATDQGFLQILPLNSGDAAGINIILAKYSDQGFQLADACWMYLAERENISTVFTLDEKDFSVYRLPNGDSLQLLPRDR